MTVRLRVGSQTAFASLLMPLFVGIACDAEPDAAPGPSAGTTAAGGTAGSTSGRAGAGDAPNGGAPEASGGTSSPRGGSSSVAGADRGGSAGAAGSAARASGGTLATGDAGVTGDAGTPSNGAGSGGTAGKPGSAGASGDESSGGTPGDDDPLRATVTSGVASVVTAARPTFGAMLLAADGARVVAVESRRDAETGPFGLPWRSRFRVAAYDDAIETWAYAADPDDVVSDVVVHPSGDVTIAVLSQSRERMAYDLLRFDRDGALLGTTTLSEPSTTPDADFGTVTRPMFRMKSDQGDATVGGWVRLVPDGEGLVAVFLSYIDRPSTEPLSARWALGLEAFDWEAPSFHERWARIVEGPHRAQPVAWTYDELRWNEQAIRPFFARDDVTGDLLVGRAWNNLRCEANVSVFAEFTHEDCVLGSVGTVEDELLPLAVTRFSAAGARLGSVVLAPDEDAAEQVAFALVAHDGKLYTAGAVVRENPDGSKRTYPDADGYVDYDGYVAVYDARGLPVRHHDYDLGRGDMLAALRLTPDGVVAVGAAGWNRWQGGMSISWGADPLLAWLSSDGTRSATRVLPLTDGSRHYNLHDVLVMGSDVVAHGFSDAPMTHSADGGHDEARTFGALRIQLAAP
jgi:hypothetical protein